MENINSNAKIVKNSIKNIISIYDDINREGLKDTPKRVSLMYHELLTAKEPKLTFFSTNGYDEMIVDKNISFYTLCEHHLLPFFGNVKIGYIPNKKIIGLSKLARIVDYYSKRLNTQEYFTNNIANYINNQLKPLGVGVIVEARHLCQEMRGVKKQGVMLTSALKGMIFDDVRTRNEFLQF